MTVVFSLVAFSSFSSMLFHTFVFIDTASDKVFSTASLLIGSVIQLVHTCFHLLERLWKFTIPQQNWMVLLGMVSSKIDAFLHGQFGIFL